MKIINAHAHVLKKPINKEITRVTLKDIIKDMDEAGVEKSVLFSGFMLGNEYSLKELVDLIKGDKRFVIASGINLDEDISNQLKETEEYIKKGLVKALKIYLGYQYYYPYDEKLKDIYKLCMKYDLPVIFHTGDTLFSTGKIKYSHPINIDEVAVENPKLKIIIAHLGNPWFLDTAELIYKNKNVYADLSGLFFDINDTEYIEFLKNKIKEVIAYSQEKASKLLFGTDFPLINAKDYIRFIKNLNLDKELEEKIFYKNAENLFKL